MTGKTEGNYALAQFITSTTLENRPTELLNLLYNLRLNIRYTGFDYH